MGTQTEKARGKQRVTGMGTQTEKARRKQRVTAVSAVAGPSGGEVCELSCSRAVHCLTRGVLVLQVQHNPAPAVLLSEHTAAPLEDCEEALRGTGGEFDGTVCPTPPRLCPSPCVPCARVCPLQGSVLPPASPAWQCSLSTAVRSHTEELRTLGTGAVAVLRRVAGPSGGEVSDPLHPSQPTVCPALPR